MHQINWQVFQESWSDDQGFTREYGKYCSIHNATCAVTPSCPGVGVCVSLSEIFRVLSASEGLYPWQVQPSRTALG